MLFEHFPEKRWHNDSDIWKPEIMELSGWRLGVQWSQWYSKCSLIYTVPHLLPIWQRSKSIGTEVIGIPDDKQCRASTDSKSSGEL